MEHLNLIGAAVSMPLVSDTVLGTKSGFRQALFRKGVLFRIDWVPMVSVNLLDAPVPADQQGYVGQRPTVIHGFQPFVTADLRQLRLRNAQLYAGLAWTWTTWDPAQPKTVSLSNLYLYKMWHERLVEIKAGYIDNSLEFVGMQVGGSIATSAQGVYAVLPFQAGMSYFPLPAPSLNFRVKGSISTYFKIGAQRSLDAGGGVATQARNRTGFRFVPNGNRLLLINEAGYQRASNTDSHYTWFRAGYLHNETSYRNLETGRKEAGNSCAYALLDYQIRQSATGDSGHGLYVGGTAMAVPEKFNAYHRYFEARLYQKAPFRRRPGDVLSVVAAYRGHSKYVTGNLARQGKTFWRGSPSLTASYSMRVMPGNYLTVGLGYIRGAAITPRVPDALTFTASWGLFV